MTDRDSVRQHEQHGDTAEHPLKHHRAERQLPAKSDRDVQEHHDHRDQKRDAALVRELLDTLGAARVREFVADAPPSPAPWGLDRPVRLSIHTGKDQDRATRTVLLGHVDAEKKGVYALREGESTVLLVPEEVWNAVAFELASAETSPPPFLAALTPDAVKRLTRSGFLLRLRAGEVLLRKGTKEQELYVILDGVFEVVQGRRRVALRTRGDLIGEMAFFTEAGRRTASVRALTDGRALVLRRKFLRELTRRDPEAGYRILMNMGRVMAERLAEATRALATRAGNEE